MLGDSPLLNAKESGGWVLIVRRAAGPTAATHTVKGRQSWLHIAVPHHVLSFFQNGSSHTSTFFIILLSIKWLDTYFISI